MRIQESSRRDPYSPKREIAPIERRIKPDMYLLESLESLELDSVKKSISSLTVIPDPQMKTKYAAIMKHFV